MELLLAVIAIFLLTLPTSVPAYRVTATRISTTTITAVQGQEQTALQLLLPKTRIAPTFPQNPPLAATALVHSKLVGVVVDTNSEPIQTSTLVQLPLPQTANIQNERPGKQDTGGISLECSEWRCWPRSVVAGITAAIILCTIAIGFLIWCLFDFPGLRRKRSESRHQFYKKDERVSRTVPPTKFPGERMIDQYGRISRDRRSKPTTESMSQVHCQTETTSHSVRPINEPIRIAGRPLRKADDLRRNSKTSGDQRNSGQVLFQTINDLPRATTRGRRMVTYADNLPSKRERRGYHGQQTLYRHRSPYPGPYPGRLKSEVGEAAFEPNGNPAEKKSKGLIPWMALLPLALTTINMASEPKGEWQMYLDGEDKKKGGKVSGNALTKFSGRERIRSTGSRSLDLEMSRRRLYRSQVYGHKNKDNSSRRAYPQETQRGRIFRETHDESPCLRVQRSSFGEGRRLQDAPEELRRMLSARSRSTAIHRNQRQQCEIKLQSKPRRLRTSRENVSRVPVSPHDRLGYQEI